MKMVLNGQWHRTNTMVLVEKVRELLAARVKAKESSPMVACLLLRKAGSAPVVLSAIPTTTPFASSAKPVRWMLHGTQQNHHVGAGGIKVIKDGKVDLASPVIGTMTYPIRRILRLAVILIMVKEVLIRMRMSS